MGIKGLFKFLSEAAPKSIREQKMESFTGQTLAIDASMSMYQFLVAVRSGGEEQGSYSFANLTNSKGEVTSHFVGFISRTLKMLTAGIKPVYVFDGKPPDLKSGELDKRRELKEENIELLEAAEEEGDVEAIKKYAGRTVKITGKMIEDVKELLEAMGCPVVQATSEAEATCAAMTRAGVVYAAVTEDADVLTFEAKKMIKNLFGSQGMMVSKTKPVYEIDHELMLQQLDVTREQFIDFCILCGCDYMESIRNVGPSTAFKLIKKFGSIEKILESRDEPGGLLEKHVVPEYFPFREAREFFKNPDVTQVTSEDLIFRQPDYEVFSTFLRENDFQEEKISRYVERLKESKKQKTQMRIDAFFTQQKKSVKDSEKFNPFKKKVTKNAKEAKKPPKRKRDED